jgi:Fe-S cluster biogenesis protein NfuA
MTAEVPSAVLPDTYESVRQVVDGDIRPLLRIHGGDVRILQVTCNGHVELAFDGACRGCALQTVTYACGSWKFPAYRT